MRNVDFHLDSGIVLHITGLRGQVLPAPPAESPALDDRHSFILSLQSARIAIDMASLSTLLNHHVFAYPGAPLRHLQVTTDGDQLVQRGVLGTGAGVRFTVRATVAVTPEGRIRLHPTSVKVIGINVKGVMKLFGIELEQMMRLKPGYGAHIEGNDIILDPTGLLPPPTIRGRLTGIKVEEGQLTQTFGSADSAGMEPLRPLTMTVPNYMYFRHGTLRFGRLTMSDADLEIDDNDPADPFAFSLDHYNEQMVAGYAKGTLDHGLVVHMPDLGKLRPILEAVRPGSAVH